MASKKNGERKGLRDGTGNAWTFPKNLLEEAIKLAQVIEEKNAGKSLPAIELAKLVGFRRARDWRFLDLLRSANLYGLLIGTGAASAVSLDAIGEDVVAPSSPHQRQKALRSAFDKVELFRRVDEYYRGKKLPEDEYLANTLVREFQIPRERVEIFIRNFRANLRFVGSFGASDSRATESTLPDQPRPQRATLAATENGGARQFLDTCFVLMPFDDWRNRYYKEIYVPAIKEAGFDPVRADDIFSTGSLMEQIWDEIVRAKVLLADLTNKNPNVFYELGLAHAIQKPVILIAEKVEDVPFDLRHLRVITYEVREPKWAERLSASITDYVKHTKEDPSKSIPQPFRDMLSHGDDDDDDDVAAIDSSLTNAEP